MEMKQFTEGDWNAFAGCESDNPTIGDFTVTEIPNQIEDVVTAEGVIILDGKNVQMYLITKDEFEDELTFLRDFKNGEIATIFVNGLKSSYTEHFLINALNFNTI